MCTPPSDKYYIRSNGLAFNLQTVYVILCHYTYCTAIQAPQLCHYVSSDRLARASISYSPSAAIGASPARGGRRRRRLNHDMNPWTCHGRPLQDRILLRYHRHAMCGWNKVPSFPKQQDKQYPHVGNLTARFQFFALPAAPAF